jgi:hypothetical protein
LTVGPVSHRRRPLIADQQRLTGWARFQRSRRVISACFIDKEIRTMERILKTLCLLVLALAVGPLLARPAETGPSPGASAPAFVVSVMGPSLARPARLMVREGQMASYAVDGRAVGITVRRAPAGFAAVEVVELREVESIKQGGEGPRYETKAAIDLRTAALGEAWELPGIDLSLAVSAEPMLDASSGGEPACPGGVSAKQDPGTCCVRCGQVTICAYCVFHDCGSCCVP